MEMEKYFRVDKLPHIWCPGCGHGSVMMSIVKGIDKMGWDPEKVAVVSGIGCSSRAPGYMNFNTLHTVHGRPIAFATGIKLANPELHVIVITGDGDGAAIGGNHLIHACRRNIGINVVLFNNQIYGMTSGQYSPMTPEGSMATTSPYGNIEPPFDLCELTRSAGANFVARGTVYHLPKLDSYIEKAFAKEGFSYVEAISQCPTYYGRRNKMKTPLEMLEWQKKNSIDIKKARDLDPEQLKGKIITGIFAERDDSEYTARYDQLIKSVQGGKE